MVSRNSIISTSRQNNYEPMSIDISQQCDRMLDELHAKIQRIHTSFMQALQLPEDQFGKAIAIGLFNMELSLYAHQTKTLTASIKRLRESSPSHFFSLRTKIVAIANTALNHAVYHYLVTARANESYLKQLQWHILCHAPNNRMHLYAAYNALVQSHQVFCAQAPLLSHWHQAQREQLFLQLGA